MDPHDSASLPKIKIEIDVAKEEPYWSQHEEEEQDLPVSFEEEVRVKREKPDEEDGKEDMSQDFSERNSKRRKCEGGGNQSPFVMIKRVPDRGDETSTFRRGSEVPVGVQQPVTVKNETKEDAEKRDGKKDGSLKFKNNVTIARPSSSIHSKVNRPPIQPPSKLPKERHSQTNTETPFDSALIKLMEQKIQTNVETDENAAFCTDLCLRMGKLSPETLSLLKFQIASLLYNVENPNLAPVPIPVPSPSHTVRVVEDKEC